MKNTPSSNSEFLLREGSNLLKNIVATIYQINENTVIENLAIAKTTGLGLTAGTFTLASLVGTASTGTAIGTLSGAAATNATLAWVGGSIFAGSLMLFCGAVAGGYFAVTIWNSKPRTLEELTEIDKEIISDCLKLAQAIDLEDSHHYSQEELKMIYDSAFHPLLMKIYKHNDELSTHLTTRYKLQLRSNRTKLLAYLDDFKKLIN